MNFECVAVAVKMLTGSEDINLAYAVLPSAPCTGDSDYTFFLIKLYLVAFFLFL